MLKAKKHEIEEKYWKVLCTQHLEAIFQTTINIRHITEKKLMEFIETLMAKYALLNETRYLGSPRVIRL
jgi:hypothetical protein